MDLIAGIVVLTGFEGDYYFEWNIYLSFKFVIQAIAKKKSPKHFANANRYGRNDTLAGFRGERR